MCRPCRILIVASAVPGGTPCPAFGGRGIPQPRTRLPSPWKGHETRDWGTPHPRGDMGPDWGTPQTGHGTRD